MGGSLYLPVTARYAGHTRMRIVKRRCMMRNKLAGRTATTQTMRRLVEQARYEVLPTASTEDLVLEHVPLDRVITVTASPGKGLEATFDLAGRLADHGYAVVPHLAARMVSGRSELAEICARFGAHGISR